MAGPAHARYARRSPMEPPVTSRPGPVIATAETRDFLPGAAANRCSSHLLLELLALNEEMIEQLKLERLSGAGTAGFLTKMIEQHDKVAALLRTQLAGPVDCLPLRAEYPVSRGSCLVG